MQTRRAQTPVSHGSCGFESRLPYPAIHPDRSDRYRCRMVQPEALPTLDRAMEVRLLLWQRASSEVGEAAGRRARLRPRVRTVGGPGRHRAAAPHPHCARTPTGRGTTLRAWVVRVRISPSARTTPASADRFSDSRLVSGRTPVRLRPEAPPRAKPDGPGCRDGPAAPACTQVRVLPPELRPKLATELIAVVAGVPFGSASTCPW